MDEELEAELSRLAEEVRKSARDFEASQPQTLEEARDRVTELEMVLTLILAADKPDVGRWIKSRVTYDEAWDISTPYGRAAALARIALGRKRGE